LSSVCIVPS